MPMRCFNPSIEGQPLQLGENLEGGNGVYLFQSLYRGTAIATKGYFVNDSLCKNGFQSLYRGTAIATEESSGGGTLVLESFNPSIEGQPLQLTWELSSVKMPLRFNPSVEGQPLQQAKNYIQGSQEESFNPSVEGQPLQRR